MAVGYPVAARPVAGTPATGGTPAPSPISGTGAGKIGSFGTALANGRVAVNGLQKPGNIGNRAFYVRKGPQAGKVAIDGRATSSFALASPPAPGRADIAASSVSRLATLGASSAGTVAISGIGSGRIVGLRSSATARLPIQGGGLARFTVSSAATGESVTRTEGEGSSRFDLGSSATAVVRIAARGSARLATAAGSGLGRARVAGSGFAPLAAPGAWSSADVPALARGVVSFGLRSQGKIVTTIAGRAETGLVLRSEGAGIVFDRVLYPRSSTKMRRTLVEQERRTDVRQDRRTAETQDRRYVVGGLNVNNQWPDKSPGEVLDYEIEWSKVWRDDDTIESVEHKVIQGTVEVLQEKPAALPPLRTVTGTVVWLGGGEPGEQVEIYAVIKTKKGRVKDATRKFKIKGKAPVEAD